MIFDPLSSRNGSTRFKWDPADKDASTAPHEHDGFHEFQPTLTAKLLGTEPPSILSTTQRAPSSNVNQPPKSEETAAAPGRPAAETADEPAVRTNDGSETGNPKRGLLRWFKHSLSHLGKDLITKMAKEPARPTPSGKNKDERGPTTTFLVFCCICLSSTALPSKDHVYGRKYSCCHCNCCGVRRRFPKLDWASSPSRDTPLPAIIECQWNTPLIPPKSSVPVLIYSCLFPCSLWGRTKYRLRHISEGITGIDMTEYKFTREIRNECYCFNGACDLGTCNCITGTGWSIWGACCRSDPVRQMYLLPGSRTTDVLKMIFCLPCTLVQREHEVILRQRSNYQVTRLHSGKGEGKATKRPGLVDVQPKKVEDMRMDAEAYHQGEGLMTLRPFRPTDLRVSGGSGATPTSTPGRPILEAPRPRVNMLKRSLPGQYRRASAPAKTPLPPIQERSSEEPSTYGNWASSRGDVQRMCHNTGDNGRRRTNSTSALYFECGHLRPRALALPRDDDKQQPKDWSH